MAFRRWTWLVTLRKRHLGRPWLLFFLALVICCLPITLWGSSSSVSSPADLWVRCALCTGFAILLSLGWFLIKDFAMRRPDGALGSPGRSSTGEDAVRQSLEEAGQAAQRALLVIVAVFAWLATLLVVHWIVSSPGGGPKPTQEQSVELFALITVLAGALAAYNAVSITEKLDRFREEQEKQKKEIRQELNAELTKRVQEIAKETETSLLIALRAQLWETLGRPEGQDAEGREG